MSTIIAARFDMHSAADAAVNDLKSAGFAADDIHVFYVTPPGQHHTLPAGGDEMADAEAKPAAKTAVKGAAAGAGAGALVGAVGGPLGAAIGAGVGAYTGSMIGAMTGMTGERAGTPSASGEHARCRLAGEHVAVRADPLDRQQRAVEIFYARDGKDVERAEGAWRDGVWVDFDPLTAPVIAEAKAPASRR